METFGNQFHDIFQLDVIKYTTDSKMVRLGVWATELEVTAAAAILNTNIFVYKPYGGKLMWQKFRPFCSDIFVEVSANIDLCAI